MRTGSPVVTIRPATPADLPAISRLGALLVRTHHDFDPERFLPATSQTEQAYAAFLGAQLEDPDVIILVAACEGEVVGYTYSSIEGTDYMALRGPAGMMHDLLVAPTHRGQGIGQRLLDATMAALKAHGAPRFVLWAAVQNEAAQRMFARAGFRPTMIEMTREASGE
jgi:ribosomal protein S18 acetylase RimI-like enzyme